MTPRNRADNARVTTMADTIKPSTSLPDEERARLYMMLEQFVTLSNRVAADTATLRDLRITLAEQFFKGASEGTTTMPLEYGKALKLNHTVTRTAKQAAIDEFNKTNTSNSLKAALDELVKWKPEVSVSKWKALTSEERLAFADIVTEKDGLPAFEIATPKR